MFEKDICLWILLCTDSSLISVLRIVIDAFINMICVKSENENVTSKFTTIILYKARPPTMGV